MEQSGISPFFLSTILTAAGSSSRMGTQKQLLSVRGKSLVLTSLELYLASSADEVVVVTGAAADRVEAELRRFPVKIARNERYLTGLASSIVAGCRAVSPKATSIMIALGDMPLISPETIQLLISCAREYKNRIVAPFFDSDRGHPVIFPSFLLEELLMLKGERGADDVIKRHVDLIFKVQVRDSAILKDLDTPNDWKNFVDSIEKG